MKKVCKAVAAVTALWPVLAIGAIGYCFLLFGQHGKKSPKGNARKDDSSDDNPRMHLEQPSAYDYDDDI